jgi:hypothetical protein
MTHPVPSSGFTVASSYGLDHTHLGPQFPANEIVNSKRALVLNYRASFYKCRQHDWKAYDWNGAMRRPDASPTQPLIGASVPDFYVPLNQRRPMAPYRLARTIVGAFTTLIFGHGRWPTILSDDPQTQDFVEALVKASKLKTKMIRARNIGGSSGSVGMSWGFKDGRPLVRVHAAKSLYVHEWADEDDFVPAHAIELYQYEKDVWDSSKRKHVRKIFWHRRDWTENADIEFVPCEVTKDNPTWQIDEEKSVMHNDGLCHLVWIQNLPDDDETSVDGQPDYAELYEQLDSVDILNSVNVNGTSMNLDPTLKLSINEEDVGDAIIKKGSNNALVLGMGGDASYLELSGSAVSAGHSSIEKQREQVLETCQCIVPDPNEVVGSATSSIALRIVYAPMLSKGDIMRDQYGDIGLLRVLEGMLHGARRLNIGGVVREESIDDYGIPVIDEVTGEPVIEDVEYYLALPPRKNKIEILDDDGMPTGEFRVEEIVRVPGNGRLTLEWPDYFRDTQDDRQKQVTSLSTATGGKATMSQQTAVEVLASSMQRDPQVEWVRIRNEQEQSRANVSGMFPGTGGEVSSRDELPEASESIETEEPSDEEEEPTSDTQE